ncbi:MAG TPA: HAD-IA family hydrolase [Pyrinomonadaceae bacterium]|nr:HAD-IA family hydrolase [Pyrinomonadaceae bacterium]
MQPAPPTLENTRAILFDFGDTLASLSPTKEELFIQAAASLGVELSLPVVRRAYQIVDFHNKYSSVNVKDRADFYRSYNEQLCEAIGISSHFDDLQPRLVEHFKEHKSWQLFEDVLPVLSLIQQKGIPLGLVANWDRDLPELTERLGIKQYFATIVSSQEAGVEKPDPAIFESALRKLSLPVGNDRVLYVGNEYRADVMGARSAGLTPILIDRTELYANADCRRYPTLRQWSEAMS